MANTKPLVSVVTATYNRPEYLAECMKSVMAQTVADWEMIVADDGSNPPAEAGDDGRIRVVRCAHSGLPGITRNRAIEQARGRFIVGVDDDDMLTPKSLEFRLRAYDDSEGKGLRFVCGSSYNIGAGCGYQQAIDETRLMQVQYPSIGLSIHGWRGVHAQTVLAPRELYETYGLFDESADLRIGEDREMWARWMNQGVEAIHCGRPVVFYRLHRNNSNHWVSAKDSERMHAYRDRAIEARAKGITVENTPLMTPNTFTSSVTAASDRR